jgi:hypothetical protein
MKASSSKSSAPSSSDVLPPHDTEAEAGGLACVLCADNTAAAEHLLGQLSPDHFYDLRHRAIYRALVGLHRHGKSIDLVSLDQALRDSRQVEDVGGVEYLTALPDKTPSPAAFPTFLEALEAHLVRRTAIRDSAEVQRLANDLTVPSDAVAEAAWRLLTSHARDSANCNRLTIRRPDELLAITFDESDRILGDRLLAKGQSLVVVGSGGLGKSRFLLQLAVATITGRPFVGFETRGQDLRWIILQAENSNRRLQSDFARLREWTGPKVWPRVNEQLLIHTLESDADGFMSLDNPAAQRRIADAITEAKPDVVCFDSLYNFGIGDLNKDEDMGATLLTISRLARAGNPERAIVVLHHALTGRAGAARANGYDRSSFGRNSKILHSWTRGQLNIAPGTSENNDTLVLTCGKLANGQEFPPFAVRLDHDSMIYEVAEGFDISEWQGEMTGRNDRAPLMTPDRVRELCALPMTKAALSHVVRDDSGCARQVSYRYIQAAERIGKIRWSPKLETYSAK